MMWKHDMRRIGPVSRIVRCSILLILLAVGAERLATADTDAAHGALTVAGRVVDAKGQPVAGAKLYLDLGERPFQKPGPPDVRATTGPDGRFHFTVDPIDLAMPPQSNTRESGPLLAAFAEGHGPAWTADLKIDEPDGLVLKLAADDVPITGRLLDLEGRPVPGATARAIQLDETPEADLSRWLDDIPGKRDFLAFAGFVRPLPDGLSALVPPATTGPDGRFRLVGLGRERLVSVLVEGPTIATHVFSVITRLGASRTVRLGRNNPAGGMMVLDNYVIHAGQFDDVCAPTRPVEGTVRDRDTGLPLPGVVIRADGESLQTFFEVRHPSTDWRSRSIRTTTDANGHYRLSGLPIRDLVALRVEPAAGLPYFASGREVGNKPGSGSNRLDFGLKRGILIRGRVIDRATGQPARAIVEYHPANDNTNANTVNKERRYVEAKAGLTHADGSFAVVALPGPGVVAATAMGDRYLRADQVDDGRDRAGHSFPELWFYQRLSPPKCHAFAVISPDGPATCDLALTPGPEPTVKILDSAGRPLAGAVVSGIPPADFAREGWWQAREKAAYPVRGLTEHRIRVLFVHHEGRKLAGTLAVRDGETGPLVVRLRPWGSVSGRLVDHEGRPRAGVRLSYRNSLNVYRPATLFLPRDFETGADGRFSFEGLVPGQDSVLRIALPPEAETPFRGAQPGPRVGGRHRLKPGEIKDLGDVREVGP
jgi:protocatechuate 3,4-dioxygenase beta subunit